MTPPPFRLLSLCLFASSAIAAPKIDLDRYRDAPSEIAPIVAPFAMPQLTRPSIPQTEFNILDFGAVKQSDDAEKLNTDAIHQAIAAAHSVGGGRVIAPGRSEFSPARPGRLPSEAEQKPHPAPVPVSTRHEPARPQPTELAGNPTLTDRTRFTPSPKT